MMTFSDDQCGEAVAQTVRVFLVDDHEVVRQGVTALLASQPDMVIAGEAATAAQALARAPASRPDIAVLDVRLPDGDGVQVCRELRAKLPGLACLMLTSYGDDEALFESVMAGAAGYVLKQIRGSDLINAIRVVAGGGSLLDQTATTRLLSRLRTQSDKVEDPLHRLTDRERLVLDLVGRGLTNRQIGAELSLSEKTVKNYVSSLLSKLGMQRRTQAAVLAAKLQPQPVTWTSLIV
jgi:two-component system response regulator DevR